MALKLVLFDLDGTLLDTLDDLADATNAALAAFGLPSLPAESYKLMVGNGARVLMQRAVRAASQLAGAAGAADANDANDANDASDAVANGVLPGDAELVAAFNREYDHRWANRTRPYPGIPDLLRRLRAAGLQLAILSNKPDAFTCKMAEHFFPDYGFDLVSGMKPGRPGKPDPGLALELCRRTGFAPEAAAMVGDSSPDILTAVAAGMEPIGVLWGFRSAEELRQAGARHLVRTTGELGDLLLFLQDTGVNV